MGLAIVALLGWAYAYPMARGEWSTTWKSGVSRLMFVGLSLLIVWLFGRRGTLRQQWLLRLAFLVLIWMDVRTHAPQLNPRVAPEVYLPGLARQELALPAELRHGGGRLLVGQDIWQRMRQNAVAGAEADYLGRRLTFFGNCNLLDAVPKISGFFPLYVRTTDNVVALIEQAQPPAGLLDFLGVTHVSAPGAFGEWKTRKSALPLITAGQAPIFCNDNEALNALADARFDPHLSVCLPPAARDAAGPTQASAAQVTSVEVSAHRISAEISSPTSTWVTIAQTHHPRWRAKLDGAPVPLWRSNYAFQSVAVPAGKHRVTLEYRDSLFHAGMAVSGLSLCGCVGLLYRRRREGTVRECLTLGAADGVPAGSVS